MEGQVCGNGVNTLVCVFWRVRAKVKHLYASIEECTMFQKNIVMSM